MMAFLFSLEPPNLASVYLKNCLDLLTSAKASNCQKCIHEQSLKKQNGNQWEGI